MATELFLSSAVVQTLSKRIKADMNTLTASEADPFGYEVVLGIEYPSGLIFININKGLAGEICQDGTARPQRRLAA